LKYFVENELDQMQFYDHFDVSTLQQLGIKNKFHRQMIADEAIKLGSKRSGQMKKKHMGWEKRDVFEDATQHLIYFGSEGIGF